MQELKLHVSNDEMIAYLDIPQRLISKTSRNTLHSFLKRHHVVYGINNDMLEDIAKGLVYGENIPVATGVAMKPAIPGKYEWLVTCIGSGNLSVSNNAYANKMDQKPLYIVNKGQELVKLMNPGSGTPGITVKGKRIPVPEEKNAEITTGHGTKMENGCIVAMIEGVVAFDGTTVSIRQVKTFTGDIDRTTGDFYYDGVLRVTGSILQGTKIYVKGDIYVSGNIEDAEVKCDSSVIVGGEIIGKVGGVIECSGELIVKRVSFFSLIAGHTIKIHEDALHSTLISDTAIHAKRIIGGSANACTIMIGSAGSKENVKTILNITRAHQIEKERYDLLKNFGAMMSDRSAGCDEMYYLVRDRMDEQGYLKEEYIKTLEIVKQRIKDVMTTSELIRKRLSIIEISDQYRKKGAFIKADVVYPGTMYQSISQERTIINEERDVLFAS